MRGLLAILILLGLGMPLRAQEAPSAAPDVVVRQSLDPADSAVIGQHVALYVDVLFHGDMPRPPRISVPDVPGVQAFRFETQGLTMRETIAGEAYIGQRFEFALYARRGGTFSIPPAVVTLLDRQGDVSGSAQGHMVPLKVTVPAGVDASQPVVATRALTLKEAWEPAPKGAFNAGDALVRTITRTAEDVPGLAMRDLAFPAPEGVRVYVDPPDTDDHSDRGVLTGRRVDRVTYVFERGGRFELPALAQPWWDLAGSTLKTAEAAGVAIDVAAVPAGATAADGTRALVHLWAAVAAAIALLVALKLGLRHMLLRRRADGADAEDAAFRALRRACAGGSSRDFYRAFSSWRRCLPPSLRATANTLAAPADAALFGGSPAAWDAVDRAGLVRRLDALRHPPSSDGGGRPLPPLNPIAFNVFTNPPSERQARLAAADTD